MLVCTVAQTATSLTEVKKKDGDLVWNASDALRRIAGTAPDGAVVPSRHLPKNGTIATSCGASPVLQHEGIKVKKLKLRFFGK